MIQDKTQKFPAIVFCLLGGVMAFLLVSSEAAAEVPDEVVQLEVKLFDPVLPSEEVDRLLARLEDPEMREAAKKTLIEKGQGHRERIIHFARKSFDIEARQACADVIETLDASYRTTELGKKLGVLYRKNTETLLPRYWARFRKNTDDLRAVAMLMHADAEKTYAWLGKLDERHARIRYLLLRIRELPEDQFAAAHIKEHTVVGANLVVPEIFPHYVSYHVLCHTRHHAHREVGHTFLKVVAIEPGPGRIKSIRSSKEGSPLLKIDYVSLCRRWVCCLRGKKDVNYGKSAQIRLLYENLLYVIALDNTFLGSEDRAHSSANSRNKMCFIICEGKRPPCPLPWVDTPPWNQVSTGTKTWYKPYIPLAYQQVIPFYEEKPGEKKPVITMPEIKPSAKLSEAIGPSEELPVPKLDASAPTVVILSPKLPQRSSEVTREAAELLRDRMAQELAASSLAQVINRTQLDAVLQEYKLTGKPNAAMFSCDALIRLDVDPTRLSKGVQLKVIGLSNGNLLSEATVDWPVTKKEITPLVAACGRAMQKITSDKPSRPKVRFLGIENLTGAPRLEHLKRQAVKVFQESLERSKRLEMVYHMESNNIKEESLLLMMGLSKLPGRRAFAPQADATIELRLNEKNEKGKTFKKTPLELGIRINRGKQPGRWMKAKGTVGRFDKLVRKGWKKLAASLDEVQANNADKFLDDIATRHKQAKEELQAAHSAYPIKKYSVKKPPHDPKAVLNRLQRIETTMKLDPTWEEAAFQHLVTLEHMTKNYDEFDSREYRDQQFDAAIKFMGRFEAERQKSDFAFAALYDAMPDTLMDLRYKQRVELTPEALDQIDALREVIENGIAKKDAYFVLQQKDAVPIVYRGMRLKEVPLESRIVWLQGILKKIDTYLESIPHNRWYLLYRCGRAGNNSFLRIHSQAIDLLLEDEQFDLAKQVLEKMKTHIDTTTQTLSPAVRKKARKDLWKIASKLDDESIMAKVYQWALQNKKKSIKVRLKQFSWPTVYIFDPDKPTLQVMSAMGNRNSGQNWPRSGGPAFETLSIADRPDKSGKQHALIPLAEGEGQFYALRRDPVENPFVSIPLNPQGLPDGKIIEREGSLTFWNNFVDLPKPPIDTSGTKAKRFIVEKACFTAGRLCVATKHHGILVFDAAKKEWSVFGLEQGVPTRKIGTMIPFGDAELFCSTCIINLKTKQVRLIRQPHAYAENFGYHYLHVWKHGSDIVAVGKEFRHKDKLNQELESTRLKVPARKTKRGRKDIEHFLRLEEIVELDGRRFGCNSSGLYELDLDGNVIRYWLTYIPCRRIPVERDAPILDYSIDTITTCSPYLVISNGRQIQAFDPRSETWYGPVSLQHYPYTLVSGKHGVWVGNCFSSSNHSFAFIDINKLIELAKRDHRVLTTDEFHKCRTAYLEKMPPLSRAKMLISMHRFEAAEAVLQSLVAKNPDRNEVLLLLAYLNRKEILNRPEKEAEYYRQVAKNKTDPDATFTAYYYLLPLLCYQKKHEEAYQVGAILLRDFPNMPAICQKDVDIWYHRAELDFQRSKSPNSKTRRRIEKSRSSKKIPGQPKTPGSEKRFTPKRKTITKP